MNLQFHCFGGKSFRPQAETSVNEELGVFSIVTPWGPRFQAKQVSEALEQNYAALLADQEFTSIHKNLASLSYEENILRRAVLQSNERIHQSQNEGKNYSVGYELVCGAVFSGSRVSFAQAGHPAVYLDRSSASLQPLGHILDLAGGASRLKKRLPPLPSQLFGIYPDIHCSVFRVPLLPGDRLTFISRAFVPGTILETAREERTLENLALLLAKDDKSMPFWLGQMDFS